MMALCGMVRKREKREKRMAKRAVIVSPDKATALAASMWVAVQFDRWHL